MHSSHHYSQPIDGICRGHRIPLHFGPLSNERLELLSYFLLRLCRPRTVDARALDCSSLTILLKQRSTLSVLVAIVVGVSMSERV